MRVIDNADHQDLDGVPLNVDTTPPTINGTLSGTLGSNNIYISPVEAAVSVSDNLSGIAATEYTLNGSGWQPYSSQLTLDGGVYALQFRTKDTAGLMSTTQVYDFSVDTHGPNIKLPSRWYIWEKGELFVKDEGSKIASVHYEIRDSQGRWKKVEQSWNPNTETFTHEISWDRLFADGALAPIGEHPVRVTAIDHAGHSNQKTARIIIPPANATPLPTFTPTPTLTPIYTPTATSTQEVKPATATITPTPFFFVAPTPTQKSGGGFFGFGNPPKKGEADEQNPNPLIGIVAAAVTGAFIATQRKKETVQFGSAPKEAIKVNAAPNVFQGAQASALIGAFTAKMEEDRQRREAEKAALNAKLQETQALNVRLAIIAREKREAARRAAARRAREEAKQKAAVNPLQALWDANGAAIYADNQNFKATYGRDMDAATRKKAIKDATVNGHFNAGAYAGNLVKAATPPPKEDPYAGAADRIRAAANEIEDEKKIGYVDSERDEVRKLIALNEQKNAPVDSATASYMAAAAEAGKFSKEDYDRAREQAEENQHKEEKTWLSKIPFIGEKLDNAWLNSNLKKAWDNTKTFVREKIVEPVQSAWDTTKNRLTTVWESVRTKAQSVKNTVVNAFQEHPVVAWATSLTATTAAAAGGAYYYVCYGAVQKGRQREGILSRMPSVFLNTLLKRAGI